MKFETMMLRSLFGACIVVCGLFLAAMVTARPIPLAAHGSASTASVTAMAAGSHGDANTAS